MIVNSSFGGDGSVVTSYSINRYREPSLLLWMFSSEVISVESAVLERLGDVFGLDRL